MAGRADGSERVGRLAVANGVDGLAGGEGGAEGGGEGGRRRVCVVAHARQVARELRPRVGLGERAIGQVLAGRSQLLQIVVRVDGAHGGQDGRVEVVDGLGTFKPPQRWRGPLRRRLRQLRELRLEHPEHRRRRRHLHDVEEEGVGAIALELLVEEPAQRSDDGRHPCRLLRMVLVTHVVLEALRVSDAQRRRLGERRVLDADGLALPGAFLFGARRRSRTRRAAREWRRHPG